MEDKKNIVLALSGGAARGLAHIGVLEVLEENHIPIDAIVGTSSGALIGGIYAAGKLKEFKKEILNLSKNKILIFFLKKKLKGGRANPKTVENFLKKYISRKKIEDLPIQFNAVATDLKTAKRVIINKGSLLKAIMASIALPGAFQPIKYGKKILVDGGILDPLPENYAYKIGKKVISVNAIPMKIKYKKRGNVFDILEESFSIMIRELIFLKSAKKNSFFIQLKTQNIDPYDFTNINKKIELGRKTTKKYLKKLIKFIN